MTSISRKRKKYIDKLDDIVDKYNNTYRIIKMKPDDIISHTSIKSSKKLMMKILN